MKRKQLKKTSSIQKALIACFLAMLTLTTINVWALDIVPISTGIDDGNGTGCYTRLQIKCPSDPLINFGTEDVCNFTGVYGPPYACTSYYCGALNTPVDRKCVKAN